MCVRLCLSRPLGGVSGTRAVCFRLLREAIVPYLLGRRFTVRKDHKNLVFLSYSTIPRLIRWRVLLSEFQYQVEHFPGRFNLVADRLTRVSRLEYEKIKPEGRHPYEDDTISRIFAWRAKRSKVAVKRSTKLA